MTTEDSNKFLFAIVAEAEDPDGYQVGIFEFTQKNGVFVSSEGLQEHSPYSWQNGSVSLRELRTGYVHEILPKDRYDHIPIELELNDVDNENDEIEYYHFYGDTRSIVEEAVKKVSEGLESFLSDAKAYGLTEDQSMDLLRKLVSNLFC